MHAHSRQLGFVLVERLLIAAVMLAGVVGVVAWFSMTTTKSHARDYAQATVALIQATETGMGASQSYYGLTTAEALERGFVPDEFVVGGQVDTAWGTLTLAPAGVQHQGFEVRFSRVPADECADFVQALAPGMAQVLVNGQQVVGNRQVDVPAMAAACKVGGEIALVRQEPGYGLKAGWETW